MCCVRLCNNSSNFQFLPIFALSSYVQPCIIVTVEHRSETQEEGTRIMKKFIFVLTALLLVSSVTGCSNSGRKRTLVVGSETFSGYFIPSEGLSNSAADATIRDLLHGGELVYIDETGELAINKTVVKEHERSVGDNGDVTYRITIADMLWSDGEAITSDDYIFAFLLAASPAYAAAGALDASGEGLLGYWDYYDGVENRFAGLQKIDDTTFSFIIDAQSLPYFWELMYIAVSPYPMHALTQDNETIQSSESGSFFDGDMEKAVDTFITTYNETQSPSCGAYTLETYENNQVSLNVNPNFIGDEEGLKPTIEHIIVKEIFEDTAMDALIANEIDLLEPVLESDKIDAGKAAADEGKLQAFSYPRNGYGVFAMKDDQGATKEVEVRRALAYLIDRTSLTKEVMGTYGSVIDSDYALDQWMVKESKELDLPYTYAYSIKQANEQLDASSYRFERDGTTPFDPSKAAKDYYRYNEAQEVLEIRHLATDDNQVSDIIEHQLMKDAASVGIKYRMDRSDEAGIQEAYYLSGVSGTPTPYNAFTLGSEFASIPDPYYASISCDFVNTTANPSNYCDEKMETIMADMRYSDPNDAEGFLEAWKAYIAYYNETLPQIPLYTSTYYGFASSELEGYQPNAYQSWASQIAQIHWK